MESYDTFQDLLDVAVEVETKMRLRDKHRGVTPPMQEGYQYALLSNYMGYANGANGLFQSGKGRNFNTRHCARNH